MPKTKSGEEITWSEFMTRWKQGISDITPQQKAKSQLSGTWIQLVGITSGLIISLYNFKALWWVALILAGVWINTFIQLLSLKSQLRFFKDLESNSEEVNLFDLLPNEDKEVKND